MGNKELETREINEIGENRREKCKKVSHGH
jgi:hypothetical protein